MSFLKKPLPKGWRDVRPKKSRNKSNNHASGRRNGSARTTYTEREIMKELAPASVKRGEYLFANCVVLAAAVFGPASQAWAENLLPSARMMDWRNAQ